MRTLEEVLFEFTPQGKLDPGQAQRLLKIEVASREFASEIFQLVPESPHRTVALRKILEAKFTAIQAVTHPTQTKEVPSEKAKHKK